MCTDHVKRRLPSGSVSDEFDGARGACRPVDAHDDSTFFKIRDDRVIHFQSHYNPLGVSANTSIVLAPRPLRIGKKVLRTKDASPGFAAILPAPLARTACPHRWKGRF
jgi:hypothetical protein